MLKIQSRHLRYGMNPYTKLPECTIDELQGTRRFYLQKLAWNDRPEEREQYRSRVAALTIILRRRYWQMRFLNGFHYMRTMLYIAQANPIIYRLWGIIGWLRHTREYATKIWDPELNLAAYRGKPCRKFYEVER